jgi:hypothetical protein
MVKVCQPGLGRLLLVSGRPRPLACVHTALGSGFLSRIRWGSEEWTGLAGPHECTRQVWLSARRGRRLPAAPCG